MFSLPIVTWIGNAAADHTTPVGIQVVRGGAEHPSRHRADADDQEETDGARRG